MSFFEDTRGQFWPISRIDHMTRSYKEQHKEKRTPAKVYIVEGDEYGIEISDSTLDRIVANGWPVIPAQPGFDLLAYWWDAGGTEEPHVEVQPIIGWRIEGDADGDPVPLIVDYGFEGMGGIHAVRRPGGRVVDLFGAVYDDQAVWEKGMRAQLEEELARKSRAAPA